MKKLLSIAALVAVTFTSLTACGQDDKSKRPSPPATATETIASGATVTINYGQPSLKGRTMGKDVEPMQGKVWRAGANEATTFETNKDVTVEGKKLPAGKYSLFMTDNGNDWTVIFNKNADIWGTDYDKNKSADVLQVKVKPGKTQSMTERLTYNVDKSGKVSLMWGDRQVDFRVQ